jgi:hypothetical protein
MQWSLMNLLACSGLLFTRRTATALIMGECTERIEVIVLYTATALIMGINSCFKNAGLCEYQYSINYVFATEFCVV